MTPDLRVTVWDGAFNRRGWVGDPESVEVTERFNQLSTATVKVRDDHHRLADLTAPGARLTIDHDGRRLISGPVCSLAGSMSDRAVTVGVQDDLRVLQVVLGWPVPGNALTAQTSAYDVRSGAAETVLKGFVTANAVTRLGLPVTVATDQARGTTIKVQSRFHPLWDRLMAPVETAGLGVRAVQDDATGTVLFDVFTPATYPRTLTVQGGVVQDWAWTVAGPTATRVIAGDQGQGTARSFTTTTDAVLEAEWATVAEVFRDARDTDDAATVTQRRADALAEGAPKRGLSLELAESAGFRYGQGIAVGDTVTVQVAPGVVVTDVLREAVLRWDTTEGLRVTPVVGERTDDSTKTLARAIAGLGRAYRHLAGSR